MKRLFILAAATVALASCAKTQVVYNEEPQEIAFRQVENVMTKGGAGTSLGNWSNASMGVFAYKEGEANPYFTNANFAKHSTQSYWVGNGTQYYWPFQGSLDFYFYAPHQGTGASVSVADKELTISAFTNEDYEYEDEDEDGDEDNTPYVGIGTALNYNCADLMYGSEIITKSKDEAVDNEGISVTLKHALALVQVNAKATTENLVTILSMTLKETPADADLTVNYTGSPLTGSPSWTDNSTEHKLDLTIFKTTTTITSATLTESFIKLGNEVLVIPGQAQTSFSIEYQLANSETVFNATLPLNNAGTPIWKPGKKYVYNITFGVEEIKFAPVVEDWGTGGVIAGSNGGVSVAAVSEQP